MSAKMILKQLTIGPLQNYIYLLGDPVTRQAAVVDPAWDVRQILAETKKNELNITQVLLTHGHPDHINGLDELLAAHDIPIVISRHEAPFYMPGCKNLHYVDHRDILKIGEIKVQCLHTPGHTPGCVCFSHDDILLTGDTLFVDGCGRCDLPGGDASALYESLYKIILRLPDSTVIYPGHEYGDVPFATLGELKKTNPYLSCRDKKEFLVERMGIEPE